MEEQRRVTFDIIAGRVELSLGDLLELREGSVISLEGPLAQEVVLSVDGAPVACATLNEEGDATSLTVTEVSSKSFCSARKLSSDSSEYFTTRSAGESPGVA